jgi:3',5'-cyclic AMP phosphodiesterase CpdA
MIDIRKITMLGLVALTLVAAGCQKEEKQASVEKGKDLNIAVVTDIHYLSSRLRDGKEMEQRFKANLDGREIGNMDMVIEALIADFGKVTPDALIVSGDLTFNGEKKSHEDLAKVFARIEELGVHVLVTPGNHDVSNPFARELRGNELFKTDYISPEEFTEIYKDFGFGDAVKRTEDNLSYLYKLSDDAYVLMMDSAKYNDNLTYEYPYTEGVLSKSSLDLITEAGAMAKETDGIVIPVMHHNVLNHSETRNYGYTIENDEEARSRFREAGLKFNLSGHIHIQDIHFIDGIYDIVTGAFVTYPNNYGVLSVKDKTMEYRTQKVDVDGYAREKGLEEHYDFSLQARERFKQYSVTRFESRLKGTMPDKDIKPLTTLIGEMNAYFFSGEEVPESVFDRTIIDKLPEDDPTREYIEKRRSVDKYENNYLKLELGN